MLLWVLGMIPIRYEQCCYGSFIT